MKTASNVLARPRTAPAMKKPAHRRTSVIHAPQKPDAQTVRFVAAIKRLKGIL